ncbi:hypothetical protein DL239_02550 [Sedimentitalea sp. CY04]|uniref:Uncharacterized protein n=1 Tax=Parasedimentitalea denitrificans TaxID=2211118 RepID=A0ABX0W2J1_9RHOB|nr:hypothetical protein [Sedimentitalea sp. CY04]NIZ59852.1 hypothetical protein [Sedimentitalea sp. CY04]
MEMAKRTRKPKNLSLDPELVDAMEKWCKAQDFEVKFARAVDVAIKEFLKERGALPERSESEEN